MRYRQNPINLNLERLERKLSRDIYKPSELINPAITLWFLERVKESGKSLAEVQQESGLTPHRRDSHLIQRVVKADTRTGKQREWTATETYKIGRYFNKTADEVLYNARMLIETRLEDVIKVLSGRYKEVVSF